MLFCQTFRKFNYCVEYTVCFIVTWDSPYSTAMWPNRRGSQARGGMGWDGKKIISSSVKDLALTNFIPSLGGAIRTLN